MSIKKQVIDQILLVEGDKYTNDPDDSGGETRWGITVAVARANGYKGLMQFLPREVAFNIYAAKYWDAVRGDELEALSKAVAEEVVDTHVNLPAGKAGEFLQKSLNVLNSRQKLYPDLVVDGQIGGNTLLALSKYLTARDEHTLLTALNCLQGAFYIELALRREKDERFVYGWLRQRVFI